LGDFAVLIQKDLARMATKDDIKTIREEMATKHFACFAVKWRLVLRT